MNNFIFLGNEKLATGVDNNYTLLKNLIRENFTPALIVLNGSAKTKVDSNLLQIANECNIEVVLVSSAAELNEVITTTKPSFGVLAAFGMIIPQNTLDLFPKGVINVHPSLLPLLRGSTPIESAIYNLPDETGVTIIKLVNEMDAGPILDQATLILDRSMSKQVVYSQLADIGARLLVGVLKDIDNKLSSAKQQDESQATYTKHLSSADANINFNLPASELEQKIKAHQGWPGSTTTLRDHAVQVITAYATTKHNAAPGTLVQSKKKLGVVCGNGKILDIHQLQPQGKNTMNAASFINGYLKN